MFNLDKQANTKLEVNKLRLEFGQCFTLRSVAPYLGLFLYLLGFLGATVSWQLASAQTFNSASSAELNSICNIASDGGDDSKFPGAGSVAGAGSDLLTTCGSVGAGGAAPNTSGAGSQSQPN